MKEFRYRFYGVSCIEPVTNKLSSLNIHHEVKGSHNILLHEVN